MMGFDELYRQIEALPQGVTGQILEAGVLTTMSRPGVAHEWTLGGVDESLRDFSVRRGGRGWWILREMEIRFPDERLAVPDLAGWRVDRLPALPRDNPMLSGEVTVAREELRRSGENRGSRGLEVGAGIEDLGSRGVEVGAGAEDHGSRGVEVKAGIEDQGS